MKILLKKMQKQKKILDAENTPESGLEQTANPQPSRGQMKHLIYLQPVKHLWVFLITCSEQPSSCHH